MTTPITLPIRQYSKRTILCVIDYGAVGDGAHDDTAAFQLAIDSLPPNGGTVTVPDGRYLIDPTVKVKLRSNMKLALDPRAYMLGKTNTIDRDYIVLIENKHDVEVTGGFIQGDRDSFVDQPGTTSEHGHGIAVYGSTAVTISFVNVSKCVGDGISVGGYNGPPSRDFIAYNVTCTGNRRQGISLVHVSGFKIVDCFCLDTHGTSPECGIDVEPELNQVAENGLIAGNTLSSNAKYGLCILQRIGAGIVRNIVVMNNIITGNKSNGCVVTNATGIVLDSNTVNDNSATGIVLNSTGTTVLNGLSYRNYSRLTSVNRVPFTQSGWTSKIERDILIHSVTPDTHILTNRYK